MLLAEELTRVYARMSDLLMSEATVQTALDLVTSLALDTIDGAVGAGVTLVDPDGRPTSVASTNDMVARADAFQYELGTGPCLSAIAEQQIVRVDDVERDPRWPQWSSVAVPLGLRSSLSVPIAGQHRTLGAVKVYGAGAGALGTASDVLLTRFAAQAAILIANVQSLDRAERLSDDLQQALRDRNVIALASGILMERHQLNEQQAFLRLVEDARRVGRGLVDEANQVTLLLRREPE